MSLKTSETVEIIAELAQGFEGKIEQTELLLKAAAKAGANAAKYQLVYADELATPDYQYYELFKSLEMTDEFWHSLAQKADQQNIQLHFDIFGEKSLALSEAIGVSAVKVHGTDISNIGFLKAIASSKIERVLLGAGGAYQSEIDKALEILSEKKVVVFLGFQAYPTPNNTNQISRVAALANTYSQQGENILVGFADHAAPDNPLRYALAAVAIGAGAKVIEKHLSLGSVMELEDFESSLNPDEFLEFVNVIQGCAQAYGITQVCDDYGMSKEEKVYRKAIRRHVISVRNLDIGHKISPQDVILKRSSAEVPITDISSVYNIKLKKAVSQNSPIILTDLDG